MSRFKEDQRSLKRVFTVNCAILRFGLHFVSGFGVSEAKSSGTGKHGNSWGASNIRGTLVDHSNKTGVCVKNAEHSLKVLEGQRYWQDMAHVGLL